MIPVNNGKTSISFLKKHSYKVGNVLKVMGTNKVHCIVCTAAVKHCSLLVGWFYTPNVHKACHQEYAADNIFMFSML